MRYETITDIAFQKGLVTCPISGRANGVDGDATAIKPPLTLQEKSWIRFSIGRQRLWRKFRSIIYDPKIGPKIG